MLCGDRVFMWLSVCGRSRWCVLCLMYVTDPSGVCCVVIGCLCEFLWQILMVCTVFNPFTAPACKTFRLKSAHIHACKQYIWWSYNKSTFNTVHFGRSPFTCSGEERGNRNHFKFGTSVGRFSSDSAASTAVKGLNNIAYHLYFPDTIVLSLT